MRNPMPCLTISLAVALSLATWNLPTALAQTAQRQLYKISPGLQQDLEAHQLDSGQVESVVNAIAQGLAAGDIAPILDQATSDLRITDGSTNVVIKKEQLAQYQKKLLSVPDLGKSIIDDDQVIIKGNEVGLARGTFWIAQKCLDDACSKKKSALVTINLP
jgi:hypothetical protein